MRTPSPESPPDASGLLGALQAALHQPVALYDTAGGAPVFATGTYASLFAGKGGPPHDGRTGPDGLGEERHAWMQAWDEAVAGRPTRLGVQFPQPSGGRTLYGLLFQPVTVADRALIAVMLDPSGATHAGIQKTTAPPFETDGDHIRFSLEASPVAIIRWDASWRVQYWSPQAEVLFGWTAAEVRGKLWSEIGHCPPDQVSLVAERYQGTLGTFASIDTWTTRNLTRDGREILCLWHNAIRTDGYGAAIGGLSFVIDMTANETARRNLEYNERLFEALGRAGQLLLGSATCIAAAPAALAQVAAVIPGARLALLEVPRAPEDWARAIRVAEAPPTPGRPGAPRPEFANAPDARTSAQFLKWCRHLFHGQTVEIVADSPEAQFLAPYGPTAALAVPLDSGNAGINVLLFTTEAPRHAWSAIERGVLDSLASMVASALRRDRHLEELERSERRFRLLIEDMPSGVALFRRDGTVALCNSSLARLLELDPGREPDATDPLLDSIDEDGEPFDFQRNVLDPVFRDCVEVRGDLCCVTTHLTHARIWLMISADPILDADGRVENALVVLTDVTERRLAESRLESSLREKEILLQEVFHRVKNNLQTVSTLLRMQARSCPNTEAARAIDSAHARVLAMALVHEQLHATGSLRGMDLCETVRRIGRATLGLLKEERDRIEFVVEGGPATAGVTETMLFGLILNELLTNAFKHGFANGQRGTVRVRLAQADNQVVLEVADDGRGPPEGFDPVAQAGLGLRIVKLLVQQLHGTLDFGNGPGFRVTITAPLQS